VACTPHSFYGYGIAAMCRTDSGELNAEMVRRGWAIDDTKYSGGRYVSNEVHARRERLGIWAGGLEIRLEVAASPLIRARLLSLIWL
jgi:endonuclease YncB( thermonuclease family)